MRARVVGPHGRRRAAQIAARDLRLRVRRDLHSAARSLGLDPAAGALLALDGFTRAPLVEIERLVVRGAIRPWLRPRIAHGDGPVPPDPRELRIGVFPVAGNPLHWGHLGCALLAMARLRLDTVVIVIAGADERKPHLMDEAFRHEMAQACLSPFEPFLVYSPVARRTSLDGERNLFRLLSLNPRQRIDAVYLAGSDHCRRVDPLTGQPDTIEKLERNTADKALAFDPRVHRVSAAFFERERASAVPGSSLPVVLLPGPPMRISSTMIREAVAAGGPDPALIALPPVLHRFLQGSRPCAAAAGRLLPAGCR